MADSAVVLLSGGQDSTTAFYWALERFDVVAALTFEYRQRHGVEMEFAKRTAEKNGIDHVVLPVEALYLLGQSSLTNPGILNTGGALASPKNVFAEERGLPPSFTPGRNLLFFTLGAMVCAKEGATSLVTGVCQTDSSGYPDCRAEFVAAMEAAIWTGFAWASFQIEAPLLKLTKAETWALAADLGRLVEVVNGTSSCYEGDMARNDWGYGCGACGACVERRKGYEEYMASLDEGRKDGGE